MEIETDSYRCCLLIPIFTPESPSHKDSLEVTARNAPSPSPPPRCFDLFSQTKMSNYFWRFDVFYHLGRNWCKNYQKIESQIQCGKHCPECSLKDILKWLLNLFHGLTILILMCLSYFFTFLFFRNMLELIFEKLWKRCFLMPPSLLHKLHWIELFSRQDIQCILNTQLNLVSQNRGENLFKFILASSDQSEQSESAEAFRTPRNVH